VCPLSCLLMGALWPEEVPEQRAHAHGCAALTAAGGAPGRPEDGRGPPDLRHAQGSRFSRSPPAIGG
jgi:hypothetical protein